MTRFAILLPCLFLGLLNCSPRLNRFPSGSKAKTISSLQVENNQLTLQGAGLGEVVDVKVEGQGATAAFNITSQTDSWILAVPLAGVNLLWNTVYQLILTDTKADSFPITFTIPEPLVVSGGNVGIGETSPGARLHVNAGAPSTRGQIVKGAASQSANLTEWQNMSGTVLSSIDAVGTFVGKAKFIGARVRRTTNQSISSAADTAVSFDAERFDTDGFHSELTTLTRLTIPTDFDGYYRIDGSINWASNTTSYRVITIRLNGVDIIGQTIDDAAVGNVSQQTSATYYLNANDYVELIVNHNVGGSLDVEVDGKFSPEFWIEFLGK